MAQLFIKHAKLYAETRPSYPAQLFQFIASKTPHHHLAWDIDTGNGQAAQSLAGIYKKVIATDTSPKQLEFATKLPNIRYQLTSPIMSSSELEENVAAEASVNLVTVAHAMRVYQQVKWVLKKPHGVMAARCSRSNEDLDYYFAYITSWSAYQTATDNQVELLTQNVIDNFERAWNEDGHAQKIARFPVYLRIGKVGSC